MCVCVRVCAIKSCAVGYEKERKRKKKKAFSNNKKNVLKKEHQIQEFRLGSTHLFSRWLNYITEVEELKSPLAAGEKRRKKTVMRY